MVRYDRAPEQAVDAAIGYLDGVLGAIQRDDQQAAKAGMTNARTELAFAHELIRKGYLDGHVLSDDEDDEEPEDA